jgi:signal transduction histidine kinase
MSGKDNGSGISAAQVEMTECFGSGNMQQSTAEIGGTLEIQTAAGVGTTIIVSVPVSL